MTENVEYVFDPSASNRAALNTGEALMDALQDQTIPALMQQADATLAALGDARQRRAERDATRDNVLREIRNNRDRGLR